MRLVTAGNIYKLECPSDPCQLDGDDINLGDTLAFRIEKKTAWLSADPHNFPKKQKFKILEVTPTP